MGEYETNDIVISPSANNQGKISKAWQNAKQSLGEVWDGFQIIGQGWRRAFSSEGAKELKAGAKGYWQQGGEAIHTGLDVAGAIPGFGEPADGANALIYLAEGDYFNAGTSGAAMVPFLGWGAVGSKYLGKAGDLLRGAEFAGGGGNLTKIVPSPKNGIWTPGKVGDNVLNAYSHWQKHGSDFPHLQNAKQYVEAATDFLHNPPSGTLTKVRTNGDVLRYDPSTNTFGILDANGVPRTMYKPTGGINYWNNVK